MRDIYSFCLFTNTFFVFGWRSLKVSFRYFVAPNFQNQFVKTFVCGLKKLIYTHFSRLDVRTINGFAFLRLLLRGGFNLILTINLQFSQTPKKLSWNHNHCFLLSTLSRRNDGQTFQMLRLTLTALTDPLASTQMWSKTAW